MKSELERAAGVIPFRQDDKGQRRYLLLHHTSGGHWHFPKGHIESGETAKKAALRELSEETGISQIELVDGFSEQIEYDLPAPRRHKQVLFYLGRTQEELVRLSAEHDTYTWLSYLKARARLTYENTCLLLDLAEDFLRNQEAC